MCVILYSLSIVYVRDIVYYITKLRNNERMVKYYEKRNSRRKKRKNFQLL